MSTKRIALLMIAPAVLAHLVAIPAVVDVGSALDASISQTLLLAGICGYSLAGGAVAYLYALETSRSPLGWTLAVIAFPFAAPFALGCLSEKKSLPIPTGLLPQWNLQPFSTQHDLVPKAVYANPEWNLSLPLSGAWRVTAENALDPTGKFIIVGLEGDQSLSGKPVISMSATGCAHIFSPEEISAYVSGQLAESRPVEAMLKAYHDTYKDEFMLSGYYMGQEILAEGSCTLGGLPAVGFLGHVLSPTGRIFEKQINVFGPGGACRYVCSMPEEQRLDVEAYFDRLVQHCAPFVGTNLWSSKLLALEPTAAPLTTEALVAKTMTLMPVTPDMLKSDTIPMPSLEPESQVWRWKPDRILERAMQAVPHGPEASEVSVLQAVAALTPAPVAPVKDQPESAPQQVADSAVRRVAAKPVVIRRTSGAVVSQMPESSASSVRMATPTASVQTATPTASVQTTTPTASVQTTTPTASVQTTAPMALGQPTAPTASVQTTVPAPTVPPAAAARAPAGAQADRVPQQAQDSAMRRVAAELVAPRVKEASATVQITVPTAPAQITVPTAPAQITVPTAPAQITVPTAPVQQSGRTIVVSPEAAAGPVNSPITPQAAAAATRSGPKMGTEPKVDAPKTAGPIVSWKLDSAQAAPATRPLVSAQPAAMRKTTESATVQAAAKAKAAQPPASKTAQPTVSKTAQPAACFHCGKTVLSKGEFVRELSARHGVEIVTDSSGRLKARTPAAGTGNGEISADVKRAISKLQQDRALKCTDCDTVFCLSCLAAFAPSHESGGKACMNCQSPSLVAV